MVKNLLIFLIMINLLSCKSSKDLPTVAKVDIEKYAGKWYEIARLPNSFEKNLERITATYTPKSDGNIEVLNQGFSTEIKEKVSKAKGKAWIPNADFPGRLKVSFFWPFAGNYYIIFLDENYKYALVGDPSRKYLWILSRTQILDESIFNKLLEVATNNGFDVATLIKVNQNIDY